MEHKPYNGYWNYETWAVALHIDNDEAESELWEDRANYMEEDELVDSLKGYHEEIVEDGKESLPYFAKDLLDAAFSEVNWREIARNLREEEAAESDEEAA